MGYYNFQEPVNNCYATLEDYDLEESTSNRSSTGTSSCGSRRKVSRYDQSETNHSSGSLLSTMQRFVQTVDDMNETILVPCRLMDLKFDEKVSKAATTNVNDPKGHLMTNLNGVDLFQFYAVLNSVKNDLMWGSKQVQPPHSNNTKHHHSNNSHHHHNHNSGSSNGSNSGASSISSGPSSTASSVTSSAMTSNSSPASLTVSANVATTPLQNGSSAATATHTNGEVKGHVRRPSTVSTNSSASASDTDSTTNTTTIGFFICKGQNSHDASVRSSKDDTFYKQEFSELNEDSGVEGEEEYSQQMSDSFHHHLNGLQHCLRELSLAADYITTRYNNDLDGLNL